MILEVESICGTSGTIMTLAEPWPLPMTSLSRPAHSSGWTVAAHAFAGVDISLGPRFFLTGEGRYTWARAPLGRDFSGFGRLDLSGLSVTAGVGIRN